MEDDTGGGGKKKRVKKKVLKRRGGKGGTSRADEVEAGGGALLRPQDQTEESRSLPGSRRSSINDESKVAPLVAGVYILIRGQYDNKITSRTVRNQGQISRKQGLKTKLNRRCEKKELGRAGGFADLHPGGVEANHCGGEADCREERETRQSCRTAGETLESGSEVICMGSSGCRD